MRELYQDCLMELVPYFIQGDLNGFLDKEAELKLKNFNLDQYERITSFNPLHQFLSKQHNIMKENIELTAYIQSKCSPLDVNSKGILICAQGLIDHIDYWYKEDGQKLISEIYGSVRMCESEESKNKIISKAIEFDPTTKYLFKTFNIDKPNHTDTLLFMSDLNPEDFNKGLEKIFNKVTPFVIKTLTPIIQSGNLKFLNLIYLIKFLCPEITDEKLLTTPVIKQGYIEPLFNFKEEFKLMFANENLDRKFNFFTKSILNTYGNYPMILRDIVEMYEFGKNNGVNFNLKKVNNFHDLHELIANQLSLDQENISFESRFLHLEGLTLGDYTIKIPLINQYLVDAGKKMNICVGRGHYSFKYRLRKIDLIFLEKNQEPYVCIEILPNNEIVQIRAANNSEFSEKNIINELKKLLN